jgi:hypothetical protein
MLVRESRTSSANGAFGRQERQDSAGMRLTAALCYCISNRTNCTHNVRQLAVCFFFIIERTSRSNVKVASRLRHPRIVTLVQFGGGDDVKSWCPADDQLFGAVCRKLSRGAGKLGPEQDRRPTLCVHLRDLSRIAGKR